MDLNNIKVKRVFYDPGYVTYALVELETGETIIFDGELMDIDAYEPKRWEWSKIIYDVTSEAAHFATDFLPSKENYKKFPYKEYVDIYNQKYGYYNIKPDILMKIVKAVKEYCDKPNDSEATVRFYNHPELYANDVRNEDDYGIDDYSTVVPDNFLFTCIDKYLPPEWVEAFEDYEYEEEKEEDSEVENVQEKGIAKELSDTSEEASDRQKMDIDELSETKNAQQVASNGEYACKGQSAFSVTFE